MKFSLFAKKTTVLSLFLSSFFVYTSAQSMEQQNRQQDTPQKSTKTEFIYQGEKLPFKVPPVTSDYKACWEKWKPKKDEAFPGQRVEESYKYKGVTLWEKQGQEVVDSLKGVERQNAVLEFRLKFLNEILKDEEELKRAPQEIGWLCVSTATYKAGALKAFKERELNLSDARFRLKQWAELCIKAIELSRNPYAFEILGDFESKKAYFTKDFEKKMKQWVRAAHFYLTAFAETGSPNIFYKAMRRLFFLQDNSNTPQEVLAWTNRMIEELKPLMARNHEFMEKEGTRWEDCIKLVNVLKHQIQAFKLQDEEDRNHAERKFRKHKFLAQFLLEAKNFPTEKFLSKD